MRQGLVIPEVRFSEQTKKVKNFLSNSCPFTQDKMFRFLPIRTDNHLSSMKRRRQLPPLVALGVFRARYLLIELELSRPLWRRLDLLESLTLGTGQSGTSIYSIDQ